MEENVEIKKDNRTENIIGILLIMPIYFLVFLILKNIKFGNRIIFPLCVYIPIIIGMVKTYKNYKNKVSKVLGTCILILIATSIYCFYKAYFVEHSGWAGLEYFLGWLINVIVLRIISCIFYGKIIGWKKAIIFFTIYILTVVLSIKIGFWA